MRPDELRPKAIQGISWSLILSGASIPAAAAINILLGRQGPQVLGTWAFLNLVAEVIPPFLLFGGSAVLVRFLPAVAPNRRTSVIAGYAIVVGTFGLAGVTALLLFPHLLQSLVSRDVGGELLVWFTAMVPIVLTYSLAASALQSDMEIKWVSIAGNAQAFMNLAALTVLLLLPGRSLSQTHGVALMGVLLLSSICSAVIALYRLRAAQRSLDPAPIRPVLPAGFWKYAVFLHLVTLVGFWADKTDQAIVFGSFQTASLGLYKAALVPAELVRWFPRVASLTIFPTFSNLLAGAGRSLIPGSYQRAIRVNVYFGSIAASVCILFGPEILSLFGPDYAGAQPILSLLSAAFVTSSLTAVASSLIYAAGRTDLQFLVHTVSLSTQIAVARAAIGQYGVTAIALGRLAAVSLSGTAYALIAFLLLRVKPPLEFIGLFLTTLALAALQISQPAGGLPGGLAARSILFLIVPCGLALAFARRSGDLRFAQTEIHARLEALARRRR